jgi:hypothetical protein
MAFMEFLSWIILQNIKRESLASALFPGGEEIRGGSEFHEFGFGGYTAGLFSGSRWYAEIEIYDFSAWIAGGVCWGAVFHIYGAGGFADNGANTGSGDQDVVHRCRSP